jgi:ABC-type branched-subunit amino acid transport system ATPase component
MALAHRPPLLILDEPTDGLDPVMRDEALGALSAHMADTPTTVLLSTHHVMEMEHLAAAALLKGFSGFYGAAAAMAGQVAWTAGVPSLSRWIAATTIWGLVGAALLFSLAHRRAEV